MFKRYLAIIEDTLREALARKTVVGFLIFSTISILVALLIFQSDAVQTGVLSQVIKNGNHLEGEFFGAKVMDIVWAIISTVLFFVTICIGIFTTASFTTSLMEKGNIDLLLSKPVPRWMYILGRYSGAIILILGEVSYFVVGLWIVVGVSVGYWNPAFLLNIIYITLSFAGFYSIVVLVSVLWRSSWLAIIIGITLYFVSGAVGAARFIQELDKGEGSRGIASTVASILHYGLPQSNELSANVRYALAGKMQQVEPILFVLLLIAIYLGIAIYAFQRKEF